MKPLRILGPLGLAALLAACGDQDLAPAVGSYRFDSARSGLAGQLLQLLPDATRARPGVEAVVAAKAAEVTGSYELSADGTGRFALSLPAVGGGLDASGGEGTWTRDGDKITLTTTDGDGAVQVQLLQLLGDALVLEEERQGVWIKMVLGKLPEGKLSTGG